ncbi:3'-5' exonuclease [bacterium]|nr:3'-5' exonuclease [bacterium]
MPLPDERLVFFDLETGGGESWRPIMQLAAIAVDSNLHELETIEFKLRFDPRRVKRACLRKRHYSKDVWAREAISEHDAAERFAAFLHRHATLDLVSATGRPYRVAQLVAHHASFDAPFLTAWFKRVDRYLPAHPRVLCTHQRTLWMFHEDKTLTPPADYQLGTLCEYLGVPLKKHDAHEALADVRATVALYRKATQLNRLRMASRDTAPLVDLAFQSSAQNDKIAGYKSL